MLNNFKKDLFSQFKHSVKYSIILCYQIKGSQLPQADPKSQETNKRTQTPGPLARLNKGQQVATTAPNQIMLHGTLSLLLYNVVFV